jgi:hypothetical protein
MPRSLIQVLGEMLTGVTRSASYPSSHADPSLIQRLHGLSPDAFEEWTADRFRELGYAVHRTGRSGDHGVDLVATRWGEVAIVQCKRYTNAAVGEEVVGRLYGSMVDRRADRAFLVTSARLSRAATRWIGSKPIEIWDVDELLARWPGQIARLPDPWMNASTQQGRPPMPASVQGPLLRGKPSDRRGKPSTQMRGKGPDRRGKTE